MTWSSQIANGHFGAACKISLVNIVSIIKQSPKIKTFCTDLPEEYILSQPDVRFTSLPFVHSRSAQEHSSPAQRSCSECKCHSCILFVSPDWTDSSLDLGSGLTIAA